MGRKCTGTRKEKVLFLNSGGGSRVTSNVPTNCQGIVNSMFLFLCVPGTVSLKGPNPFFCVKCTNVLCPLVSLL